MFAKGEPILIRVDQRERASGVPERLAAIENVTIEVEQLELADYILSPRLAVERKSTDDLIASILDKRLFAQSEQLREAFEQVIYLIEGPSLYAAGRLHPNAIRGALSYLAVLQGHTILRSEDVDDSALLLATMARHEQQGLGYRISLHPKRRSDSPALQMRYLVEYLPNIGPELAENLLRHFGSLQGLANAELDDLQRVPGIGPKRAQGIHSLFTIEYAIALAHRSGNDA